MELPRGHLLSSDCHHGDRHSHYALDDLYSDDGRMVISTAIWIVSGIGTDGCQHGGCCDGENDGRYRNLCRYACFLVLGGRRSLPWSFRIW